MVFNPYFLEYCDSFMANLSLSSRLDGTRCWQQSASHPTRPTQSHTSQPHQRPYSFHLDSMVVLFAANSRRLRKIPLRTIFRLRGRSNRTRETPQFSFIAPCDVHTSVPTAQTEPLQCQCSIGCTYFCADLANCVSCCVLPHWCFAVTPHIKFPFHQTQFRRTGGAPTRSPTLTGTPSPMQDALGRALSLRWVLFAVAERHSRARRIPVR